MNYDICVLGLGYIGLPTASIFATRGKKVLGVDVAPTVVETINAGRIHIQEPDLDVLVRAAVQSGNLRADHRPAPAGTYIIAVPTPFRKDAQHHKTPDLSYVEQATRSLAAFVPANALIILESTSPVGTTEKVRDWLLEELHRIRASEAVAIGATLRFAHCPERILPGQMLKELVANDRIAGGLTPDAAQSAKTLYRIFCTGEIFLTDARTAEMAKLTENSFRDVNIAFANELSLICEKLDIDVWELIRLANRHPRVKILQPGPGVGGHCIAVDPWFIVDAAPNEARLIRTAREVNDHKPERVLEWIKQAAAKFPKPVVACLGLAFKADVDDLRESPAVEIVQHLAHDFTGEILAVEPHIKTLPTALSISGNIKLVDAANAVSRANVIVLLVNHRAFSDLDRKQLSGKAVIDTRGFWK
ncbi:MAG TPA: UDP-N-acetyl-D-mannosamine dehydrogenase [Opitutales bacterium]|jgi:UDP-N-acetyl-D-mannosaminuronic acid dehydrogenase|nr:UDP-N-acetyl-D-mannosamine dehydrogenase [Opitutales bacterium]